MARSQSAPGIPASAVGAAILIAVVWGFNFVVIKVGVSAVPPLMLAALRFLFSALPAVFFVRRPRVPWRSLAIYGLLLGVGQFGFLFTAIKLGAPSGLSSILLQSQAFITVVLAAVLLKERLRGPSVVGMIATGGGLAVFAVSSAGAVGSMPLLPLLMILIAALGWAGANVVARTMPESGGLGLMVWSSLFSPLPLAVLSLVFEGPEAIGAAFSGMSLLTIGAIAYLVILSTLFGYGVWNELIMRYGAERIAPFSLMVPVFGVVSASIALGERFGALDAVGAVLILGGLLAHVFGGRIRREKAGGAVPEAESFRLPPPRAGPYT